MYVAVNKIFGANSTIWPEKFVIPTSKMNSTRILLIITKKSPVHFSQKAKGYIVRQFLITIHLYHHLPLVIPNKGSFFSSSISLEIAPFYVSDKIHHLRNNPCIFHSFLAPQPLRVMYEMKSSLSSNRYALCTSENHTNLTPALRVSTYTSCDYGISILMLYARISYESMVMHFNGIILHPAAM